MVLELSWLTCCISQAACETVCVSIKRENGSNAEPLVLICPICNSHSFRLW